MTDPLYNPEPFEQIPGQTAFDWNQAPDTRDTRPERAEPSIEELHWRTRQDDAMWGRWDPFQ